MSQTAYEFFTYDVFTDRPFGGNPLAIFPQAAGLDATMMQSIAGELNLSETVFITGSDERGIAHLRIFTPKVELPFAGHPTVGAAIHLAGQRATPGTELEMRTVAGAVRARISAAGELVRASILAPQAPTSGPAVDANAVAAAIGLDPLDLAHPPSAWSAGTPFTFAPVDSRETLSRASLVQTEWERSLRARGTTSILLFTMTDWEKGREVHARMFGPGVGIAEDPATGSAAAALAGLLCELQQPDDGAARWVIHQGEDMGRPSVIELEANIADGVAKEAWIGGTAVRRSEGKFYL